jgi:MauM/NapG family ferredoxin protein
MGTVLDWMPSRKVNRRNLDIRPFWRQGKYLALFVIIVGAALGSLTLMVLDPITLLFRTVTSVVLPGLNVLITGAESWLYGFGALRPAVDWVDGLLRPWLLTEQPFFLPNLILGGVFAVVLGLNFIRPRFWCRYLCPLGGGLALFAKFSRVRHQVDPENCISCHRCAVICPTGAVDPGREFAADLAECTTCLDCVEACPTRAISFRPLRGLVREFSFNQSRRNFLVSGGAAAVGAVVLWALPLFARAKSNLIRPPGTSEAKLLSDCIRCGECVKVCPTGVIQPGNREAAGIWMPVLDTRLGYCDYGCNACGQVCPTGAIPDLALEDKQHTVIGVAAINRDTCLPWAEGTPCIVCEEMCPVPPKAIRLDRGGRGRGASGGNDIQRPRVIEDLCIGCGICEYQCPVEGEAAIRVFPPEDYLL